MIGLIQRNLKSLKAAPLVLALTVLVGCAGGAVPLSDSFPAPIVEPLPYQVGVVFTDEFQTYLHEDEDTDFTIDLGARQTRMFGITFDALFDRQVAVGGDGAGAGGVDLILRPELLEYSFISPRETGTGFYAASMRYRVVVMRADQSVVGFVPFVAYGKSRSGLLNQADSLGEATTMALRDASAALITVFKQEIAKEAWRRPRPGSTSDTTI